MRTYVWPVLAVGLCLSVQSPAPAPPIRFPWVPRPAPPRPLIPPRTFSPGGYGHLSTPRDRIYQWPGMPGSYKRSPLGTTDVFGDFFRPAPKSPKIDAKLLDEMGVTGKTRDYILKRLQLDQSAPTWPKTKGGFEPGLPIFDPISPWRESVRGRKRELAVELLDYVAFQDFTESTMYRLGNSEHEVRTAYAQRLAQHASTLRQKLDVPAWHTMKALDALPQAIGACRYGNDVVYFLKGRRIHTIRIRPNNTVAFVDAKSSSKIFDTYCRAMMFKHSKPDVRLFVAFKTDRGFSVDFGNGTFEVSSRDFQRLRAGEQLEPSHRLTREMLTSGNNPSVMLTHPFMVKNGPSLEHANQFCFALRRAYSESPVYMEPPSPDLAARVRRLHATMANDPESVAFALDRTSPESNRWNLKIVENVADELTSGGFRVLSAEDISGDRDSRVRSVVIITGKSSTEFAKFVERVGKKGGFKSRLVILNSCETPLTRQLILEIQTRWGAWGVYAHEGLIDQIAMQDGLLEFKNRFGSERGSRLARLWEQSMHRATLNGGWHVKRNQLRPAVAQVRHVQ
jgi:hypothetical protein